MQCCPENWTDLVTGVEIKLVIRVTSIGQTLSRDSQKAGEIRLCLLMEQDTLAEINGEKYLRPGRGSPSKRSCLRLSDRKL